MQQRPTPLRVPSSALYFTVELEGREPHHFRIPMHATCASLVTQWARATKEIGLSSGLPDLWAAAVSTKITGLILGTCWHHRTKGLESRRDSFAPTESGALEYGNAVCEELSEAGYTDNDLGELGGPVLVRMSSALAPSQEEVAATVAGFPGR